MEDALRRGYHGSSRLFNEDLDMVFDPMEHDTCAVSRGLQCFRATADARNKGMVSAQVLFGCAP